VSDDADLAAELAEAAVAARLRAIDATIPAGAPGECDDCGEQMPRLVDGRCGFCRDGRRPPLQRYDTLPVVALVPSAAKETAMPAFKDGKYISVPADGATLKVIEARAKREDVALGQAALAMINDALAKPPGPAAEPTPAAEWNGTRKDAVVFLENVPDAWLIEELVRRYETTVGSDDHQAVLQERDAAVARADAAEGQLATVRAQLGGILDLVGGGGA
jgi:hypothetical protein